MHQWEDVRASGTTFTCMRLDLKLKLMWLLVQSEERQISRQKERHYKLKGGILVD